MKRVFLAINLPKHIKQEIFLLYHNIKNPVIKWANIENLHITIKFIGEIEDNDLEILEQFIKDDLNIEKMTINIENAIFFPYIKNAKIIGLKIIIKKEINKKINDFIKKLEQLDFVPREDKIFKPHITIGRAKNIIDASDYNFLYQNKITIENIDLMESTLTYNGPIYKKLETYKLK